MFENLSLVILAFVGITFLLLGWITVNFLKRKRKLRGTEKQFVVKKLHELEDGIRNNPKLALMEVDKLLDYVLERLGFKGNLGEKLKQAGPRFKDIEGVWYGHKLRNKVAHEINLNVGVNELKKAVEKIEKAIYDLI